MAKTEGLVRVISDESNLPFLMEVPDDERRDRNPDDVNQSILTMGHEEWKNVVRAFKIETAVIPPRRNRN